jgi:hypothetical protein
MILPAKNSVMLIHATRVVVVAWLAAHAALVAFGDVTDYGTNVHAPLNADGNNVPRLDHRARSRTRRFTTPVGRKEASKCRSESLQKLTNVVQPAEHRIRATGGIDTESGSRAHPIMCTDLSHRISSLSPEDASTGSMANAASYSPSAMLSELTKHGSGELG